jgi:uncharacterized protein (DUF58 family)
VRGGADVPAARTFLCLALVGVALLASVAVPWLALLALALDALLLLAVLADMRQARLAHLTAERRWPPLLAQGARLECETRIRSSASRALLVRSREALHPALAEAPLRTELRLDPRGEAVWRYGLEPRRRGRIAVGPLSVRVLGPLKLAWAQHELLPVTSSRVYPQVHWEGRVGRLLTLAHRRELGQAPLALQGGAAEPYALREYRPGDPPTKIHWKATARHGRLISRDDAWERGGRLAILLDCARGMASSDAGRSKLDHALAAALALVRVAASRGDRVTLVAFSDRSERLLRLRGAGALSEAYAATFDLEPRLAEPAYDLAAETVLAHEPRRASVVLLTSVVDLAAAELLKEALLRLSRRHRPLLVNLEDPELTAAALGAPHSPEEAFAKVSALEILLANRRLARGLREAGVRVTSTPADRLAWEALDQYLKATSAPAARRA